jgi:uncharacterized protein (DUF2237 family)
MYSVITLRHADEDILSAAKWYETREAGLGNRFY